VYDPLDAFPLWGLFTVTIVVILLAIEGGYRLGRWRSHRTDQEKETPVGAAVAAGLGLLALLVAFTFGLAASRFEARREVLLDEVNAIGTAYLRAGLLPEPPLRPGRGRLREAGRSRRPRRGLMSGFPPRYANPSTSPLSLEVQRGEQSKDLELQP
jgi:hypothetical protein